ncbi:MAG: YihY family inner membrane protein, partial [Planctomycetota bacterium]
MEQPFPYPKRPKKKGRIGRAIAALKAWLTHKIWDDPPERTRVARALVSYLRVLVLAAENAKRHGIAHHSGFLAFRTLTAVVPFLAVVLLIMHAIEGFDAERFYDLLLSYLAPGFEDNVRPHLSGFVANLRKRTTGGPAAVAAILLFFTVLRAMSAVEASFNRIVGTDRKRKALQRFAVYWVALSLGPFLLGASWAVSGSLMSSSFVAWFRDTMPFIVEAALRSTPIVLTCLALVMLYFIVPLRRLSVPAILVGGLAGGLGYEVTKRVFTKVVGTLLSQQGAVYGSLSVLFIFIMWLYASWIVVLIGLELATAIDLAPYVQRGDRARPLSNRGREVVALRSMLAICRAFRGGETPPGLEDLSKSVGIDEGRLDQVLHVLAAEGMLRRTEASSGVGEGYVPATHLGSLNPADVVSALRGHGLDWTV